MRSITKLIAFFIFIYFAAVATAHGYERRLTLVGDAEVQTDSIYLSDLLPARTPSPMREYAAKLLIGAAPQPGSTRIFDGQKIAALIATDEIFRAIEVPQQIAVHRSGHRITRDEVVAAIRKALVSNGFSVNQIQPEDVNYSSSVILSRMADAQLGVTRMDFDSGLQQVRFLMKSHADLESLPFLVTATLRGNVPVAVPSHEIATGEILMEKDIKNVNQAANSAQGISHIPAEQILGKQSVIPAASGVSLHLSNLDSVAMVKAGRMASLFIFSDSMQMLLDVVPLERGVMGETIRVKLSENGKVLRATVVGGDRLEAKF